MKDKSRLLEYRRTAKVNDQEMKKITFALQNSVSRIHGWRSPRPFQSTVSLPTSFLQPVFPSTASSLPDPETQSLLSCFIFVKHLLPSIGHYGSKYLEINMIIICHWRFECPLLKVKIAVGIVR